MLCLAVVVIVVVGLLFFLKAENAYKSTIVIIYAMSGYARNEIFQRYRKKQDALITGDIDEYNRLCLQPMVWERLWKQRPSYDEVLFSWSWGYKRIVPPDILEQIKPFIKDEK